MRRQLLEVICVATAVAILTAGSFASDTGPTGKRMSFHNRLLLNRVVASGLKSIEVLLLAKPDVTTIVERAGGRVLRAEPAVDYYRVELPVERLLEVVDSATVEAYQISSLSRGSYYRDGPPVSNAQMFRGFEVTPIGPTEPPAKHPDLPELSPAEAHGPGFTADDAGVGEWLKQHPTFDGRGVTIAVLENAQPSFSDPTLGSARSLDGREIPKIAGILNAVDSSYTDETRVRLDTVVETTRSWVRVGDRTYVMPGTGRYRLGFFEVPGGPNVLHRFAVAQGEATGEVWIDSDGDDSLLGETPLADVNERFEPRVLKVRYPQSLNVSFVMGRGREPHVVHIYVGRGSHQAMTASVAAGSRTDTGLAFGVAPGAQVLLVRMGSNDAGLGKTFEAFIEAARHPRVDVVNTSSGVSIVPDTAAEFAGRLFTRLVVVSGKPIINGAGNTSLTLNSSKAWGSVLAVGGVLSPATWASLHGGRPLDRLIVHPISAAGPSLDGAIKPDFLAPMERLAADLPWNSGLAGAPQTKPGRRLPPGYQISCCTSSTSPYAAGLTALLISAAKQSNVPLSWDRLSRALRMSAREVPGYQAHEQGNGTVDVEAAWRALASDVTLPRIVASAGIVHPLARYAAAGPHGQGILEFEGWSAGMKGTRVIQLRRESGPSTPVAYRLSWSAGDGTFRSAPTVTLPLNVTVPVPVEIAPASPGAHSALLNLHDISTNAIAFRTQATVVAAERIDPSTGLLHLRGTVRLLRHTTHYIQVPAGAAAIAFELEVVRGVVALPTILQSHGLSGNYYMHVHPMNIFPVGIGRYHVVMPNPEPGTWTFSLQNKSTWMNLPETFGPKDDSDAEYTLTVRLLSSRINVSRGPGDAVSLELANHGSVIGEPVVEAWPATLRTHQQPFNPTGLPNLVEIDVPKDAASLSLRLASGAKDPETELYLYDCTTGECFSYDIGFPAAKSQTLVVRKPAAGRWIAAVNAAPFPAAGGSFVLEEIITTGKPVRRTSAEMRSTGARWREMIDGLPDSPVIVFDLLDAASERGEVEHPWSRSPNYVKLRDRPVALGTAVYRR